LFWLRCPLAPYRKSFVPFFLIILKRYIRLPWGFTGPKLLTMQTYFHRDRSTTGLPLPPLVFCPPPPSLHHVDPVFLRIFLSVKPELVSRSILLFEHGPDAVVQDRQGYPTLLPSPFLDSLSFSPVVFVSAPAVSCGFFVPPLW